jgi:hypothetical protein
MNPELLMSCAKWYPSVQYSESSRLPRVQHHSELSMQGFGQTEQDLYALLSSAYPGGPRGACMA